MVDQPEHPTFDPTVYQLEVTDPVQGGINGIANLPLLNLANRTLYLKQQLDLLTSGALIPPTIAALNGPAFTGSTTAPNVAPGDDSTLIANTDFVQTRHHGIAVVPVGGNANVTLIQSQWGVGILVFTGVLTGDIAVLFPAAAGMWQVANRTTGAFGLTCKTPAGSGMVVAQITPYAGIWCDGVNIFPQESPNVSRGLLTFTASGNFTVPSGITQVKVTVTAAGGGGSASASAFPAGSANDASGGGGGAGGTAIKLCAVTPGQVIAVTVAPDSTQQAAGGNSAFGAFCSATGGRGSLFQASGVSAGGSPGVGVNGDVNLWGGFGGDGQGGGLAFSGYGGASYWGGGKRGYAAGGLAPASAAPGSGGGGSYDGTGNGLPGMQGTVVVEW